MVVEGERVMGKDVWMEGEWGGLDRGSRTDGKGERMRLDSGEMGGRIFQSSMQPSIHIFILSVAIFTHSVF